MVSIPSFREHFIFDSPPPADPLEAARRINRRRLSVFLIIFLLTLLPGLAWNLSRPAEYRANARLQITAGTVATQMVGNAASSSAELRPGQPIDLLTQAQILTSRPLLEEVLQRLDREGNAGIFPNRDPLAALQAAVAATPVPDTDIVELQAIGASPQLMAKIVNTIIASYRDQLFASHDQASHGAIANLRDEVGRLGDSIAEKRAKLAAFREKSGVISSERSENEALAGIKGLAESLNKANDEAAKADARLRALRDGAAAGGSPVLARDNPTLAAIEQRISQTREQIRDMERRYTPDFMAMDPEARALRARLGELEKQLSTTRAAGRNNALAAAEEDAASAHATVDRLRGQIAGQRRAAEVFSGNFHDAQAMEDDLSRIEAARRNAGERLAKLEASENARLPDLTLIEAASVPSRAWRPDYWRDAAINLGLSFGLGVLAIWFVELFNRSPLPAPAGPTTVIVPPRWLTPALGVDGQSAPIPALDARPPLPQLAATTVLPRELTQQEVAALLAAADDETKRLCAVLLLGLTPDEAGALVGGDIDPAAAQLSVRGADARTLPLPGWLASAFAGPAGADPGPLLFRQPSGQPLDAAGIATRITCAATDAGLDDVASVSAAALRHSCIAHLLRQNIRFADLARLVGQLGADELTAYAAISAGPRQARAAEVDPVMPALRGEIPG